MTQRRRAELALEARIFAGWCLSSDADSFDMRDEHTEEDDEVFRAEVRRIADRLKEGKRA